MGFFNIFLSEKIFYNNGLGFDGKIYGALAQNFYPYVSLHKIPIYYIGRLFPSFIVNTALRAFGLSLTVPNIIRGFEYYNFVLLLLCTIIFILISKELKFSRNAIWIAFLGLFFNFAIAKFVFYYPVLTDMTAYTLSFLLFYSFLKNKPLIILLLTFIGAFTWPTSIYIGLLLYIFPYKSIKYEPLLHKTKFEQNLTHRNFDIGKIFHLPRKIIERASQKININQKINRKLAFIIPLSFSAFILTLLIYMHFILDYTPNLNFKKPIERLIILSILMTISYIFISLKSILNNKCLYRIQLFLEQINYKRIIISLLFFIFIKLIINYLGIPNEEWGVNHDTFILRLLYKSTSKPLIFLISHIVYYGPITILILLFWQSIIKHIWDYGYGIFILFFAMIILSITSESRQLINFYPFFIFVLVKPLGKLKYNLVHWVILFSFSFLYSKIWYPINQRGETGEYLPLGQNYFMNFGPWMSDKMYYIQGTVVLLTGILFYYIFKKSKADELDRI
jgi:hypothetical protein